MHTHMARHRIFLLGLRLHRLGSLQVVSKNAAATDAPPPTICRQKVGTPSEASNESHWQHLVKSAAFSAARTLGYHGFGNAPGTIHHLGEYFFVSNSFRQPLAGQKLAVQRFRSMRRPPFFRDVAWKPILRRTDISNCVTPLAETSREPFATLWRTCRRL